VSYNGESFGKKLARLDFWLRARMWRGSDFDRDELLLLASREGGDVALLKGLGVDPKRICAVDNNSAACAAFAAKHPDVQIHFGDVGALTKRWGRKFGVVFLDFCGWAAGAELRALCDVAQSATSQDSVFAFAFMRGREPPNVMSQLREAADRERSAIARSPTALLGAPETYDVDGRSHRIFELLYGQMLPHRRLPLTLFKTYYQGLRSPMRINAYRIYAEAKGVSRDAFLSRWTREGRAWSQVIQEAHVAAYPGDSFDVVVKYCGRQWRAPIAQAYDRDNATILALLQAADYLDAEHNGNAHQLLNIRRARLAALRAHRTMGTYSRGASA
jgi:hypothetical protein